MGRTSCNDQHQKAPFPFVASLRSEGIQTHVEHIWVKGSETAHVFLSATPPTPLTSLSFTSNGHGMHRFVRPIVSRMVFQPAVKALPGDTSESTYPWPWRNTEKKYEKSKSSHPVCSTRDLLNTEQECICTASRDKFQFIPLQLLLQPTREMNLSRQVEMTNFITWFEMERNERGLWGWNKPGI